MKSRFYILVFAVYMALSGCVSKFRAGTNVSAPDYNGRRTCNDAYFKRKTNALGVVVTVSAGAAGGYIGYTNPFISTINGDKAEPNRLLSAGVGTLLGTGLAILGNHLFGHGKNANLTKDNANIWAAQFSRQQKKDYIPYSLGTSGITLIPKTGYMQYSFKTIQDAIDYKNLFAGEPNIEKILEASIGNFNRQQIKTIIDMFPQTSYSSNYQKRYVELSSTYAELWEGVRLYPNTGLDVEKMAAGLVVNVDNAVDFKGRFPGSSYLSGILNEMSKKLDRSELPRLITAYEGVVGEKEAKLEYINRSRNLSEYFTACNIYTDMIQVTPENSVSFLSSISDAKLFKQRFPNSVFVKDITDGYFVGNPQNGYAIYKSGDTYEKVSLADAEIRQAKLLIQREDHRQAEIKRAEEARIAEVKRAEEARLAAEARQKLIDEKGADYVVSYDCHEETGFTWRNYERCVVRFADGSYYPNLIYVDGYYGFEGARTLLGDKKILYESIEYASKDAYRLAKGQSRSNVGRYYPPSQEVTYSESNEDSPKNSKLSCYDKNSIKKVKEDHCSTDSKVKFQVYSVKCGNGKTKNYYYVPPTKDLFCTEGYYEERFGPDLDLGTKDFETAMKKICDCD